MHGRLDLAFAVGGEGRTFLARQYACYPFHVCRPHYHDAGLPGLATLYLQSCSGGLYEDDRLDVALAADEGAHAHVTTQAATVVQSMPEGHASQHVLIEGASGSYLEFLPDPQILFPGSRSASNIHVRADTDAVVLVCDACLMHDPGISGRAMASYQSEIVIADRLGRPLAIDRLRLDSKALLVRRAGIMGRFEAQGSLVIAMPGSSPGSVIEAMRALAPDPQEAVLSASLLPGKAGVIVRMLAIDGAALKRVMHDAWSAARLTLKGALPADRRK